MIDVKISEDTWYEATADGGRRGPSSTVTSKQTSPWSAAD